MSRKDSLSHTRACDKCEAIRTVLAELDKATQALQRIGEDVMPDPVRYADLTPEVVRDAFIRYHIKAGAEVERLRCIISPGAAAPR